MDDLDTTPAAPPDAVFSPEHDLGTSLVKAYQGEVSGETLFGRLAQQSGEPEHRRKLDVLRELEARTRRVMVPAMQRHALPIEPDPAVERDAVALADGVATLAWSDLLSAFEPITTQFLAMYRRIGELAPAEDREMAVLLVDHEEALREFARRELSGRADDSLDLIDALPHMS
jgi:hypothetical protein